MLKHHNITTEFSLFWLKDKIKLSGSRTKLNLVIGRGPFQITNTIVQYRQINKIFQDNIVNDFVSNVYM